MKGLNVFYVKYVLIVLGISLLVIYGFYEGKLRKVSPIRAHLAEQYSKFSHKKELSASSATTETPPVGSSTYNVTGLNEAVQRMLWTVHEMQEFLTHEISTLRAVAQNATQIRERLYRFQQLSGDYTNVISNDLEKLDIMLHLKEIRHEKWKNVTRKMQTHIIRNQNPENCSKAPKLCCLLNIGDGLAAEMNMMMPCQVQSFYSGKMLQLNTKPWPYIQGSTWENFFQPYSRSCQGEPFISNCTLSCDVPKEAFVSLPEDLADDIRFLGPNPLAWLYGQFNGYVLRPSARMLQVIRNAKKKLGFSRPIVSLQVRKTDKIGNEAVDHAVEEYMLRADRVFDKLQLNNYKRIHRKIFVATDDPNVIIQLRQKYPNHTFINNPSASEAAKDRNTRYSLAALEDLIVDLYLLASSDHIVCTFSSGVCRLAFELMQYLHPDSLLKWDSLDVPHHFVFSMSPPEKVFYDHSPLSSKEMSVKRGDYVQTAEGWLRFQAVEGKLYDGMSYADNKNSMVSGLYPSFKAFPVLLSRPYDRENNDSVVK